MSQSEIIQWTIVGLIVLVALGIALFKMIKIASGKGTGCNCGTCGESVDCKAKEIRDAVKRRQNCHDGRSARN